MVIPALRSMATSTYQPFGLARIASYSCTKLDIPYTGQYWLPQTTLNEPPTKGKPLKRGHPKLVCPLFGGSTVSRWL